MLNNNELEILRQDEAAFIKYCSKKKLITPEFEKKYDGIKFDITDSIIEFQGASGIARKDSVEIKRKVMNNVLQRREIVYHEIGHHLFGMQKMNLNTVRELSIKIKEGITNNGFNINPISCVNGLRMIEEYIVEKFAVLSSCESLNLHPILQKNLIYLPCGNYVYNTYFSSGYGVVQTILDDFLEDEYPMFDSILKECLNSKFYINLFEKYDNLKLIVFLNQLGFIYNTIMEFGKTRTCVNSSHAQKILEEMNQQTQYYKKKR